MGHHDHDHPANVRDGNRRALAVVLALTASFTVVEIIGGLLTGSLALLADAGHMLSDNFSLAVALFAAWLAGRPATPERSFGYRRAEVLGAPMLAIAALGLLVNAAGATILYRTGGESLNVEGALRHVFADALGSVGAMVAAAIIILTGWRYADPLVSVAIGLLILGSSWTLLRDSTNILLEATPRGLNAGEVGLKMAAAEGIVEVHDLHIWTITPGFPALSAHVLVGKHEDCHSRRRQLEELLISEYGISHTTLQVDHVGDHHTTLQALRFPSRLD